ncbi:hypothetical protein HFN49_31725 [Rhizobium leguminosarum]|uniref:hypothetical protein n=1 Tax=Rhizobium ruizarguesonis TaxID=2081791 RepID=UPI001A97EB70|nr:hypothetical protein [Rhizobium ruizarguesonis]MBY5890747.1 hypothetical protein [Rhizobium leguminosarum]QSZ05114.1 hypothetical protein J3P73_31370 [Rhizobium ruizarguesonis]
MTRPNHPPLKPPLDDFGDRPPSQRFEDVVARLFSACGFAVKREVPFPPGQTRYRADLVVQVRDVSSAIEIKAPRSRTPNLKDLERAAIMVANARDQLKADHAVLVISLRRETIEAHEAIFKDITLLCLDDLFSAALERDVTILNELVDITRELNSGLAEFDRRTDISPAPPPLRLDALRTKPASGAAPPPPPETQGHRLAEELLEITPGRSTKPQKLSSGRPAAVSWRLYEIVAEECFQYLFGTDLTNWQRQHHVGGKDKRFDSLAKVSGDDVFSRSLIEDFRTRYVLFEFKNYGVKLKPNVLHVTEKYLFPTAMRSTAIILSPLGFHPDSRQAARGAMRDAAKLMLDVTSDDLAAMLRAKDEGNAAGARFEPLLDAFLLDLGR